MMRTDQKRTGWPVRCQEPLFCPPRGGRLVFFEDATHFLQHDEADRVNEELLRFLASGSCLVTEFDINPMKHGD